MFHLSSDVRLDFKNLSSGLIRVGKPASLLMRALFCRPSVSKPKMVRKHAQRHSVMLETMTQTEAEAEVQSSKTNTKT